MCNKPLGEMKTISIEEHTEGFKANDPPPGTDHGWDTLTESEKNFFRRGLHKTDPNLKTFSELMKDRDAISPDWVPALQLPCENKGKCACCNAVMYVEPIISKLTQLNIALAMCPACAAEEAQVLQGIEGDPNEVLVTYYITRLGLVRA